MTCKYRCGDACSHPVPNTSENAYFGDLVAEVVSRRGMLRAGALGALVAGTTIAAGGSAATAGATAHGSRGRASRLRFTPVPPNRDDTVTVAAGYRQGIVVRWGDPILPGAPAFDFENQTAAAQAQQFGYNCDFLTVFPLGRDRALLWSNHEYTNDELMFRGYTGGATATDEQIKIALAAHGGSIVEIERVGRTGQWKPVTRGRRPFNRRIHAGTKMALAGPAAGHPLLRTAADPAGRTVRGMLNNCAGGVTPWGTVLTCEENFNQYFGASAGVPAGAQAALARYGFTLDAPPSRRWDRVEERFDLTKHPNEANRHGYVVEIDPFDPRSTPVKHTALGRIKREGATTALSRDGRAVVYSGDDERFDYIYKYVSAEKYRPGSRKHNMTLLDHGTLYVAKFTGDSPVAEIDGTGALPADGAFDGSGQWIPLASGNKSFVEGMSAAEVLIHTRLAADKVGATKMDRPEDMERNPKTGAVYVALTNNTNRTAAQADEANPRAANRHGHVIEIVERRNDAGATTFAWSIPLVCGDPADPATYFAGFDKAKVSPISCPDNVAFDSDGNLWIATDGNALGTNDGLFAMPVEGPERGFVRQFLTVPVGAEPCGPLISPDQKTVFVAVQHPGEITGATPENPSSRWPDGDQPRPSVVSVWHPAGENIGS
jgi:secreted PhoX family phosphatase